MKINGFQQSKANEFGKNVDVLIVRICDVYLPLFQQAYYKYIIVRQNHGVTNFFDVLSLTFISIYEN